MVQYDISITRSKSIPKISSRTLTWWCRESSTIFDRQDSMKPKKIPNYHTRRYAKPSWTRKFTIWFDTREIALFAHSSIRDLQQFAHLFCKLSSFYSTGKKQTYNGFMRIFQLHLSKYQRWVWFYIFLCICFSLWSYYNFEMIWHIMASSRCTMQHECIIALSSSSENESRNYFAPVDPRKSSWLLGRITRQEKKSHAKFRSEFQLYAITQGDQHIFWIWPYFLVSFPDMFDGDDFWVDDLCPTKL